MLCYHLGTKGNMYKRKRNGNVVIVSEVSPFSQLPAKCLAVYYSIIFSFIWSMAYCQKVSVAFGKVMVDLTWYLHPDSSRKMPRIESGSLFLFHQPDKAFNTVCQNGLWKIMSKFSCPPKLITLVCSFHDGMLA